MNVRSRKWILTTAALLCAGALALGGCSAAASSGAQSAASAPASSAAASAAPSAAPSKAPAASAAASAASLDSKGFLSALDGCTGWGGDAGSSLKAAVAACGLLDWAEDQKAAGLDSKTLTEAAAGWMEKLSDSDYALFAGNWDSISMDGDSIVSDPASMADLLSDAGSPNQHDSYTAKNWQAVRDAVSAALAAQSRSASVAG
jgi:hypothetical protein